MSNDRHDDKRVSAAYKEMASEKTPDYLDTKVLGMAERATRKPAYSRWMAWSRPVAWAATITLCLAITLELARDPAMDVAVEANSPALVPTPDEYKRDADAVVEQDLAKRQDAASEAVLPENREVVEDQNATKEERSLAMKSADFERQQEVAESMAEAAASDKTSLARSAAKQSFNEPAPTRARAEGAQLVSGTAMSDAAEADDSACPQDVRASASDWLDCITQLEADGLVDAAAAERELLIDTFPDFKLP